MPRGTLGWRHALGDVTPTSTLAFAGGHAFTIAGVPIARDAAIVEAGLDLKMTANGTLGPTPASSVVAPPTTAPRQIQATSSEKARAAILLRGRRGSRGD
jgi:hypothetical protein